MSDGWHLSEAFAPKNVNSGSSRVPTIVPTQFKLHFLTVIPYRIPPYSAILESLEIISDIIFSHLKSFASRGTGRKLEIDKNNG